MSGVYILLQSEKAGTRCLNEKMKDSYCFVFWIIHDIVNFINQFSSLVKLSYGKCLELYFLSCFSGKYSSFELVEKEIISAKHLRQ